MRNLTEANLTDAVLARVRSRGFGRRTSFGITHQQMPRPWAGARIAIHPSRDG